MLIQILISFLFISCAQNKKPQSEINYNGSSFIKIDAKSVHDSIYIEAKIISRFPMLGKIRKNVLITNNGILFIPIRLTKPELVEFTINTSNSFRTYLFPNDTLTINFKQSTVDSSQYTTTYLIEDNVFKYYQAKHSKLGYFQFLEESVLSREYWFRMKISKKLYDKGLMVVDSLEKQDMAFLDKYSDTLPDWFTKLERSNIQYSAAHCRILLFGNLNDFKQKEKLKINVPLNSPDAELSSNYYAFLVLYFFYGYPNEKDPIGRMINVFKKEDSNINSSLKSNIKEYFTTCYIADLFSLCESEDEVKNVDSFYSSKYSKLSTEGIKYIDQRKQEFFDRKKFTKRIESGIPAPDFEIKDVNGMSHKLSDFKRKMIYLHFWATWCGPCRIEMPTLNELINKLDDNKVIVINVCIDNELYKFKKIVSEEKLGGLNLICDENEGDRLINFYNISSIPHYVLIDENGLIIKNNCDRPAKIYEYIETNLNKK